MSAYIYGETGEGEIETTELELGWMKFSNLGESQIGAVGLQGYRLSEQHIFTFSYHRCQGVKVGLIISEVASVGEIDVDNNARKVYFNCQSKYIWDEKPKTQDVQRHHPKTTRKFEDSPVTVNVALLPHTTRGVLYVMERTTLEGTKVYKSSIRQGRGNHPMMVYPFVEMSENGATVYMKCD